MTSVRWHEMVCRRHSTACIADYRNAFPSAEVAKAFIIDDDWSNLPTPLYADNGANTEFQPSRHANRV